MTLTPLIIKHNWTEISNEPISEAIIRTLYLSTDEYVYRFSPHKYDANVRFPGTAGLPFVVYVLNGECKFQWGKLEVILNASEFSNIPKGDYRFEVLGNAEVSLMKVFKIRAI